jgi:hypothetical protein
VATEVSYARFRIEIRPSTSSNDHEVRFFGDETDILSTFWDDSLGLDPDDILVPACQLRASKSPHEALIARCSCGVIGCGDVTVLIQRANREIQWIHGADVEAARVLEAGAGPGSNIAQVNSEHSARQIIGFDAGQYEAEIERALADTTWETPDRTAARLLRTRLESHILKRYGFALQWASGRARPGTFTIALWLEPGPYQVLVRVPWKKESPEQIAEACADLLRQSPDRWRNVEWLPQKPNLVPPRNAGPTWRRFEV